MNCSFCNNPKPLKGKKISYHYTASGLENIVLEGIMEFRCPECHERFYGFGDMTLLHAAIADVLLAKDQLLTGQEIRFLRSHIGYSSEYFADVLGIDKSTLSRIENGKQKPGKPLDRHVREIIYNKIRTPDRNYDLHDRILNHPIKTKKMFTLSFKKSAWTLAGAGA